MVAGRARARRCSRLIFWVPLRAARLRTARRPLRLGSAVYRYLLRRRSTLQVCTRSSSSTPERVPNGLRGLQSTRVWENALASRKTLASLPRSLGASERPVCRNAVSTQHCCIIVVICDHCCSRSDAVAAHLSPSLRLLHSASTSAAQERAARTATTGRRSRAH